MNKLYKNIISIVLTFLIFIYPLHIYALNSSSEYYDVDETISIQPIDNSVVELQNTVSTISSGAVYNIINAGSGKYLNVCYGTDANGTNVYQYTCDYSVEQKFKIVYYSSASSYKIHAMCSSNGNNRVLDIVRGGGSLTSGQNVDIWTQVDNTAQYWQIVSVGNGKYKICPTANTSLALTSYGTSNGTSSGTTSTSAGNIFISTYTGAANQQWTFQEVSSGIVTPIGFLDSVSSTHISGWAWRSDIPNTAIDVHIYINNASTGATQAFYATTADLYRSDLVSAGKGNGYHGFSCYVNWSIFPVGTYNVHVYAIGHSGNNPEITYSPMQYTVTSNLGYQGYAVYRDLGDVASGIAGGLYHSPDDWHAGLMDETSATYYLPVIHMPGVLERIEWTTWEGFLNGETYRRTCKPKQAMSDNDRALIISLARELRTKDIGYIASHQLQATVWPDAEKIEPDDIVSIRCDGFVEYCYEYYGFRVFGNDTYWDISKASAQNLAHHVYSNIMPKAQAQQYLDLVTTNVPN